MKKYLDLEYLRKVDLPPGREAVHEGICRGEKIPRETGPRLETIEQWHEVGQVVPIQPHTKGKGNTERENRTRDRSRGYT